MIKDCTVDGNDIIYNNEPVFYYPLMNKEIFEFLKDKTEVDGIIFQSKVIYNQNVFFFFNNSKKAFDILYNENSKYFNYELNKNNYTKIESFHSFDD